MEIKINLDISNLKIRFEKALKIIDAIEHFEGKKRVLLDSSNGHGMMFPNLRTKYLHQADICERASKRLTKKLLSKNF
jgi:hypothetical protein